MKDKKINKNKRKRLLLTLGLSIFTVIGGTLAYFTTTSNIPNIFKSGLYQETIHEEFVSPTNWTPGTTTEKEITVTNTGNVDMAVRASISESWISKNGNSLPTKIDNKNVSIINFNSGWTKDTDGYYYYGSKDNLTKLSSGEESSSFINSVTFNPIIEANLEQNTSSDGKTITYTSSGNGYDDATYTLTVTLDTIQYDQANNAW